MSNICKKRNCNHEKYKEHEECIFHCKKTDFNATDIKAFWEKIRKEYIEYSYGDIVNEITIKNVTFPSFETAGYHIYNFFVSYYRFNKKVKFSKCVFTEDFNLQSANSNNTITFEKCTFYRDIKFSKSNEIIIIDSWFKNEIVLGNSGWNKLDIHKTKFSKNISINILEELSIHDSIFNKELTIDGFNSLNLNLNGGSYKQHINIHRTISTEFNNVVALKLDVNFTECNNNITINNTKLNTITVEDGNSLNIVNNSLLNGSLQLTKDFQNFNIENSQIKNKLEVGNILNVIFKESEINGYSHLHGNYNDVLIRKSVFSDLKIGSTNTININNKSKATNINLTGEKYTTVVIENSSIIDTLEISDAVTLELNGIRSNPSLKLIHDKYENINIKESSFNNVEIQSLENLKISKTTINGILDLLGEINNYITFEAVILKSRCDFPKIASLTLKESEIDAEVTFKHVDKIDFIDTKFKNEVIFLEQNQIMQLENVNFKKKMKLSKIDNLLNIKFCIFQGELDCINGAFANINIVSSSFESVLFISSSIQSINCDILADGSSDNNIFRSVVDFTEASINEIKIANSDFQNALNFMNLKRALDLSNISNSMIKNLIIKKSQIHNLFVNSKNLHINTFNLESAQVYTTNNTKELEIKEIRIDEIKWNKISLPNNINFIDMDIGEFRISNSNIEQRFRIKYSDIDVFNLISSTFEDLQIIDNKNESNDEKELQLENTTIKNVVLDKLRYRSFIMDNAHVSDAKIGYVKFDKGSRETNRFFKNYYDSISDYIKADQYYQQEMDEYYKESKKYSSQWWILDFGKAISNFGQSWTKPLIWAFLFTLVLYRIANYDLLSLDGFRESHIAWMFNDIIKFINPFSKSSSHNYANYYWAWFIHKALMTIFTYHFIVAVKRKTKR